MQNVSQCKLSDKYLLRLGPNYEHRVLSFSFQIQVTALLGHLNIDVKYFQWLGKESSGNLQVSCNLSVISFQPLISPTKI